MPWAGQTWAQIVQETTYGQYNSGGTVCYPRLTGGNSFTVRRTQARQIIRSADAGNRKIQVVANRRMFTGTLTTLLYPTQAAYWAAMLTIGTDSSGFVTPPSYSFEYWDSIQAWRFVGGKANKITINSTAEQDYVSMSVDWIFQDRDATFTTYPQPAENVYPTEVPYTHVDTASNCTIGGTAFTNYKSLNLSIENIYAGTWNELRTISALYYCGRDMTFTFGPEYLATTYRTQYENQTALAFVIEWIRATGSHNLTFQCNSSSYESNIDDDLPLDGPGYQTIGVDVFFDKTANNDFIVTAA